MKKDYGVHGFGKDGPFARTMTGRKPSEPEMQRIPTSNYMAQSRHAERVVATDFSEIEKRILSNMGVEATETYRYGDSVHYSIVKSRGGDMTDSHEAQRLVYDAVTGRIAHDRPNGARTMDVISKDGCNGCSAKPGEGHLFDCPDLAARVMVGKHIDEKHAEGQDYRDVLDKLARKDGD